MPQVHKILGQANSQANTNITLYTCPANTNTICSTLSVCNRGQDANSFRVAIVRSGESLSGKHYIVYDFLIEPNNSIFLTLGITISAGDSVVVYANSNDVSFGLFGVEIT